MFSLLGVENLNQLTIERLLKRAQNFVDDKTPVKLNGTVVNLFYEPSTRTSLSFQMAANRLGLKVLDFAVDSSSVCKGESLIDSLQTVDALGVDIAIVRHQENWPQLIKDQNMRLEIVNAGSGAHEHPTQALLDALTIQQNFNSFRGLKVAIIGDVCHSRVARSNAMLLQTLGAKVVISGPEEFKTEDIKGAKWVSFDEAISESDVVMMLRIQHERHSKTFDIAGYNQTYGLNEQRLTQMKQNAIIMHPGPVNRNVEISDEVMNKPNCKILQQVNNGVAIRMAVLEWCLRGVQNEQLVSA